MENLEGLPEMDWHRDDLKALTSQIKESKSLLMLKRRWLMDLPLSTSEQKSIKQLLPPNDKILPESLLREDDVSYEEMITCIEKGFGAYSCEKEPHSVQENVQAPISRGDLQDIFRLLNDMTNKGLCSFIKILTDGMIRFEKTNSSMKRRIRELLPQVIADKSDISEMKLKQIFQLLKGPKNFHGDKMMLSTTSEAYRSAALEVLDGLGNFHTTTLLAMHRKLRGVRRYIPSLQSKKSGWKPDSLIQLIKKMCMKMLSDLSEDDQPAEELAGALGVAGLTLKLIMNRPPVIDFRKFSPEAEAWQSDIAKAIHLVDDSKRMSFAELKRVQPLVDPECKLSDRSLRRAVRNLLTEYLYECSDMEKVPDYLVEILNLINGRAQLPSCRKQSSETHSSAQELIRKEVESVLNVSGQAKEVVLDLLPENEFDQDFARAYLDDFKGSDSVYISDEEDEDLDDKHAGNIAHHYEFRSYNSNGILEIMGETIPADESFLSTSDEDGCSLLDVPVKESGNQYLEVQEACDATSMLAYCSVGRMLYKLAKEEGLELRQGDISYLRHYSSVSEGSEESPRTSTLKFLGTWKNMLKR